MENMENNEINELDEISKTERTWAAVGHWAAALGIIPVPFLNIVGPLIVFGVEREESEYAAYHAKQSFYLQLAVEAVMLVVCLVTAITFGLIASALGFNKIGSFMTYVVIIMWLLLRLAAIAFAAAAGLKVYQGREFRYPFFGDLASKY